jgi:hypothetical protein
LLLVALVEVLMVETAQVAVAVALVVCVAQWIVQAVLVH